MQEFVAYSTHNANKPNFASTLKNFFFDTAANKEKAEKLNKRLMDTPSSQKSEKKPFSFSGRGTTA